MNVTEPESSSPKIVKAFRLEEIVQVSLILLTGGAVILSAQGYYKGWYLTR